jgi:hypothetical protein
MPDLNCRKIAIALIDRSRDETRRGSSLRVQAEGDASYN